MRIIACVVLAVAVHVAATSSLRMRSEGGAARSESCAENICGGGANYPVDKTVFYSEFTVPGLPTNTSILDEGATYFIYTNIFFASGAPSGRMNQFVPQLMLGSPLSGSSNWPYYLPTWSNEHTWVFGAQYFMELFNTTSNATEAKAATGQKFNTAAGEVLWTSFTRAPAPSFAWTLAMGVLGDASRTSIVVSPAPYMGLLHSETSSWGEPAYDTAHLNSCWELYGVETRNAYPSTGSTYTMRTIQSTPGGFPWATNWRDVEEPTCPGHPSGRFKISSNATQQDVMWDIFWPPTMSGALSVDASMPDAVAAAPLPPRAANITISAGFPLEVIRAELLGLDLEFTRHDLWNGLSAELIANREFAVQPPGTSWPRAWPAGFPPRWAALPGGAAPAVSGLSSAVSCTLSAAQPLCGLVQLPVGDGFDGGLSFGSAIGLEAGRAYTFSAVVRASGSAGGAGLVLGVSLSPALFSANLSVVDTGAGGAWTTVSASFTASVTTPRADSLTLTVRAPQGVLEFNATSLIRDDAFMGSLRADVVDALADLHFSGPLRFPGGCFAPFYRWKDGLLPRLARPTVFTPPGYCDAVAGGVNAYTDGFEPNGLGIDEYMTLVSRVGAVPAITIPLQFGTPEEIQDARDWVEYINGDASDAAAPWAALRAARGHPEPYGVKLFYLGNEIAWQARYRNYPQNTSSTGPMSGSDYAAALELLIPALRAVDPSLILLAVDADDAFNEPWLNSDFTPFISAASAHIAYANSDAGGSPASPAAATTQAKLPTTTILPLLASTRQMLDAGAGNGAHVRISVDEWGLGPPWTVEDFNVAHAIFGSSFLTVALSTAVEFGIAYTNYFEPINEGALQVLQFSVAPTPLGFVMPLYGALAGATRVAVEQLTPGGDDDVVGVAGVLGGSLTVVLTNRNAEVGFTQWVHFDGQAVATTCSVTLLTAVGGVSAGSEFASSVLAVAVSPDGWAAIPLPAFSVASVAVECSSCDAVVAASTSEE